MGIFDFWKKKPVKQQPDGGKVLLGMVLLADTAELMISAIVQDLRTRWKLNVANDHTEGNTAVLEIEGYPVAIAHIPAPIPGDEVAKAASFNYLWPEGAAESATHRSHVLLSILNAGNDLVLENRLFTQVATSVMSKSPALGIYVGGRKLLLSDDFYREYANKMSDRNLPIYLWVYLGLSSENGMQSAFTYGLKEFGKPEMEILNSTHSLEEVNEMIYDLTHYVLAFDVLLKDGETIGLSAEQKLAITESAGRYVEGDSLKIAY